MPYWSAFVQVMYQHLLGDKPLPEPNNAGNVILREKRHRNLNQNTKKSFQ